MEPAARFARSMRRELCGRRAMLWLLALSASGCFLGGQTGEVTTNASGGGAGAPSCDSARTVAPGQLVAILEKSPASVLEAFGGERRASITSTDPGFWSAAGVEPEPVPPVPVVVTVLASGTATLDECLKRLTIPVTVLLDAGDGLLRRTTTGTVTVSNFESPALVLAAQFPASATGAPLTLSARLDGKLEGTLRTASSDSMFAEATFGEP